MGSNPSNLKGDSLPIESVSWNAVQEFITKLNTITGKVYRLPTESEWEFAAGGGSYMGQKYAGTDMDADLGEYAWYKENSNMMIHPVATKKPNALGLYDMSGNVWEWCSDWLGNYSKESQVNPIGAPAGVRRVNRGGSCRLNNTARSRGGYDPASFNNRTGFRLALSGK